MSRRAFTAVELLGTTALLALLMMAVLAVIASLWSPRKLLAATETTTIQPWQESLIDIFRGDLLHAQSVKVDRYRQTVTIQSLHHLDALTRQPSHRPVEVTYYLQSPTSQVNSARSAVPGVPGKTSSPPPAVLVRQQVNVDEPTNRNTWADVVCTGVRSLRLLIIESQPLESSAADNSRSPADDTEQATSPWTAAPEPQWPKRVRLTIQWADEKHPPLDRTLQLY